MNDLRFALRQLLKNPGFTAVAVLTLAICLGANLGIFAVVDAILVRSLPLPDADRLVMIHNVDPASGVERGLATVADYFERRGNVESVDSLSLFREETYIVGERHAARRVQGAEVTPEFFHTLGVPLAHGRHFIDEELNFRSSTVAIITDLFRRDHFSGESNVLGGTLLMDGLPIRVVGVLPAGFRFLSTKAQVYRPAAHFREMRDPVSSFAPGTYTPEGRSPQTRYTMAARHYDGQMVARLRTGRSLAEAQAQLEIINHRRLEQDPSGARLKAASYHPRVEPLRAAHVSVVKPVVLLLQVGALCLLLLGVVNVAGLLLIRASGRAKEMAVRQALGAGRGRLTREILTETTLLSLAGGVVGVLLAAAGLRLASSLGIDALPLGTEVAFDLRAALVAVSVSLAVGFGLGLPIAWSHLHGSAQLSLGSETRGATAGPAMQRLRHTLIVTQIAFACVLLYGAGLLAMSLRRTLDRSPGFNPENIVSGHLVLPWQNYEAQSRIAGFVRSLLDRVRATPGVTHAALSTALPFTKRGSTPSGILPEGVFPAEADFHAHHLSSVTSDYARAMGIPLLQGRFIEDADCNNDGPRVAVIDEALARLYWPKGDAIGRRFSTDPSVFDPELAYTIVGIVGCVKQQHLTETATRGAAYLASNEPDNFQLVVRTSTPDVLAASTLQRIVHQLDPALPLTDFKPMQTRIDDSLITRRSPAILALFFAGVALLLAGLGAYGVLAYAVSQRRREIGVRMALGATSDHIRRQFLSLGTRLLAIGCVSGGLGAWAAGRTMESILFGVPSFHVPTIVVTVTTVAIAILLASLVPVRRAARISAMGALRSE